MLLSPRTIISKPAGFTLIELLISITIFLIITGMVIVNFHSGRYRDELVGAAEAISTSIREMQTATNAGDVVECVPATPEPPDNGFGFNLVKDSFAAKTFGDCAGLQPDDYRYDALDELVKDVNWNTKVPVTKIQINTGTGINEVNSLDIVFSPASEKVRLNGSDAYTSAIITLTHDKTNRQAEVQVNSITGQVFIVYL